MVDRELKRIIIHCTATPPDMDVDADWIRKLHVGERGWDDIGYHRIIKRGGTLEMGRPIEIQGAHVKGHNADSIAVVLAGGVRNNGRSDCNYTRIQWEVLDSVCIWLQSVYGPLSMFGHRDFTDMKDCPCFDVGAWWNGR